MSVGAVNKETGERIPAAGMPAIDSILSGSSTNPVQNRVVKAALDEKADTDIVASDFSTSASYTAGNYCIYNGKFYRFKNNHTGAWSASDVDEIKIAGELSALKSGLTGKSNFAAYAMDGNATVNIYHYSMAIVMSDRGGLYFDGSSNRGLQALVPSEAVTVTHVDGTNLTVTNNSQYGTNIIVLSDGDITISAVS